MKDLVLALVQTPLHWHNKRANLTMFSDYLAGIQGDADVIVLPEMFTTGFSMDVASQAEPMEGETLGWMVTQANRQKAVVTGTFIVSEAGHFYNRLLWVEPSGKYWWYNKRHLFTMANEHLHYTAGDYKLIVQWKDWRFCPLICYDLRFPVWSRNRDDYDVLLYVANWPSPRISAWDTLLEARAIENQCYVAGVNRTGSDHNQLEYPGHSAVYGPKGECIWKAGRLGGEIAAVVLSASELQSFRGKFPLLHDADAFTVVGQAPPPSTPGQWTS